MSTVTCAAYQEVGATFTNKPEIARFTYDFANDGGATAPTAYYWGRFKKKSIILSATLHVETAATGTAGGTMKLGTTQDDNCFGTVSTTTTATCVDDFVLKEAAGQGIVAQVDDYIVSVLATQALTAGKYHLIVEYMSCV